MATAIQDWTQFERACISVQVGRFTMAHVRSILRYLDGVGHSGRASGAPAIDIYDAGRLRNRAQFERDLRGDHDSPISYVVGR